MGFVLLALMLSAISGLPDFIFRRSRSGGERLAAALMVTSTLAGLIGATSGLFFSNTEALFMPWPAMGGGAIGLDPLTSFFLVPVFLIGGAGSIYGLRYWPQRRHPGSGRKLRLCWGVLAAGMMLLLISRHAIPFILGWEAMALAAYFLIVTEEQNPDSRHAGWIYLIATHVSTLTLLTMFLLWRQATGSFCLAPLSAGAIDARQVAVFIILALIGFGIKAGLMPLHFWLPGAHANAPSHVSAILSGVVLKTGVYGLLRWFSLLPIESGFWGGLLVTLGAVNGLLGIVFAIAQHDFKRLLAYSSVENIGIIIMGLGLALLGMSHGRPSWVALGMAGCLLHVWNHSLFKPLLFFCAGSVIQRVGTRQLDRMGGLAKTMPLTASFFLVGAVAICGLPPLNGFVSELFIYIGMLRTSISEAPAGMGALLGVPALAMIGALALACFVKAFGIVFLGEPRSDEAALGREPPLSMTSVMAALAAGCALIGLAPVLIEPALNSAAACWAGQVATPEVAAIVPLPLLSALTSSLAFVIAAAALLGARRVSGFRRTPTWDCGYARPTPKMQYTASSFGKMIVDYFRVVLRPRDVRPQLTGLFPAPARASSDVEDAILHRMLLPAGRLAASKFERFRRFQRGLTHHYLIYILAALIVLLVWAFSTARGT